MLTHDEILAIGALMSDLFKLITTLDTGMVGLIIAIVEKVFTTERVFKSGVNKILLGASLLSFIVSMVFSLRALVVIPYNVAEMLQGGNLGLWVDYYSFYFAIGLFIIGVFLFVLLAIESVRSISSIDNKVMPRWQVKTVRKITKRR